MCVYLQADYEKAVAEIGPMVKEQMEDIEDEKTEHQAICEVYLEEEKVLQEQIDELRKNAGDILQQAEAYKAVVGDLERRLSAARSELEVQRSKHSASEVENKRALNVFESDASTVSREIDQIDNDVAMDIADLQEATNERIKEREDDAIAIREEKTEVVSMSQCLNMSCTCPPARKHKVVDVGSKVAVVFTFFCLAASFLHSSSTRSRF